MPYAAVAASYFTAVADIAERSKMSVSVPAASEPLELGSASAPAAKTTEAVGTSSSLGVSARRRTCVSARHRIGMLVHWPIGMPRFRVTDCALSYSR